MKKISILGVLIGGVVDIVATNILAFPLILYVMIAKIDFVGMTQAEMTTALTQTLQGDWVLFTIQLLIGSFCSILGGFIAAWIAKHDELLNGALSAYLCFGLGVYGLLSGKEIASIGMAILGFILSPALGLLGGYLKRLLIRPKQQMTKTTASVQSAS